MVKNINTMLVFFWSIGIIVSSIYYILIRNRFSYSLFESIILLFAILLFEIIGAKMLFLLENIRTFKVEFLRLDGGYSLMGVFIFTPLFLFIFSLIINLDIKDILDYFITGMFIELSFYRIGCIFSGCCGGVEVSLCGYNFAFPTRICEIIFCIVISAISILIKSKNNKKPLFIYSASIFSYGVFRFFIEFLRVRTNLAFVFSIAHFLAIFLIISGLILLYFCSHKNFSKNKLNKK